MGRRRGNNDAIFSSIGMDTEAFQYMPHQPLNESKIDHPKLVALYRYWLSKCTAEGYPSRADLDPLEIPELLGHIMIVQLADPFEDSFYRLYGTAITDYYGVDMTGWKMRDVPERIRQNYRKVAETGQPESLVDHSNMSDSVMSYAKLQLPLVDDVGKINMILSSIYRLDDPSETDTAPDF